MRNGIRQKIQQLAANRVAVVAPVGNDYFTHNSQQGMAFPSIIRECISVGAVYMVDGGNFTYGSGARVDLVKPGQITPFSQRLQSGANDEEYITIFAPGAPMTSSGLGNAQASSTQHGTTQAAAAVSGLILLLQEFYTRRQNKLPTVEQIVVWLQAGGVPIFDGDFGRDNVQHTNLTFLRIDALSALDAARRELQFIESTANFGPPS